MNKDYYFWAFQLDKTKIFEVEYYLLGNNKTPDFSTSAGVFNRPKTDWQQCGQCQSEILPFGFARNFWKKWDKKHLQDLTENEYIDLLQDIKKLKEQYNFIEIKNPAAHYIPFWQLKELSMQKIGRKK